ncbi:cupin [Pandoraea horticolens]|uniref:Cupin n=1 Tax=Pandoraea horticolens TaxID=2508298 RepID=A0A5E4WHF3_9BURK|nr:cupin [Pandoraea horticolens]
MSQSTTFSAAPTDHGQCRSLDLRGKIALIDGYW